MTIWKANEDWKWQVQDWICYKTLREYTIAEYLLWYANLNENPREQNDVFMKNTVGRLVFYLISI
jgi:hypothetical protein